jgi:Fe-S oxidoreductase
MFMSESGPEAFGAVTHRTMSRKHQNSARPAPRGEVLLWPDTWNNHFHPTTAQAAVEVLEDAGFRVMIPERQLCCGRPLYDYGMLNLAETMLRDLITEFPHKKASDYVPPPLHRKAIVQEQCHQKSILDGAGGSALFKALELDYEAPDTGCCGMAGPFGFDAKHYEVSMTLGERVLLPKVRQADTSTIIVADGFSCREQIAQSTDRQALHSAQVLKMALDDRDAPRSEPLPELRYMLDARSERRNAAIRGAGIMVFAAGVILLGAAALWKRR